MKQFSFLIITLLFFTCAKANENILTSNDYILAKAHYKLGDYDTAYKKFYQLFLKHTNHPEINYFLGKSAYELKLFDSASAAFERAIISRPEFHVARLEYARVMMILGFKEEARKNFNYVLKANIPQNVRNNINQYLNLLDNSNSNALLFTGSFGMMYDTNINSGLDDTTYTLPGFSNLSVTGEEPENSTSHFQTLNFIALQPLGKNQPLILRHNGTIFNKNQTTNSKYDFRFYSYKPTFIYNDINNQATYSLELGIDRVQPGDDNDFFTISVKPNFAKVLSDTSKIVTQLKYQSINYMDESNKEKEYKKRGIGLQWFYKNFITQFAYDRDFKESGTRTDVNKNIFTSSLGYTHSINSTTKLNLQYQYLKINYKETDTFFSNKRNDKQHNIYTSISKAINGTDLVTFSYSRTDNNSNQAAYVYDRDVYMISYLWRLEL